MATGAEVCATCAALIDAGTTVCPRCGDRVSADGAPRLPLLLAGARPASTPTRVLASALDVVVALVLAAPAVVGLLRGTLPAAVLAVPAVAAIAYGTVCVVGQALTGRTPAKLVLGLRVVDVFSGLPLGPRRSLAERWASGVVLDVRGARDPATTVDEGVWTRLAQVVEGGFAPAAPTSATAPTTPVPATPIAMGAPSAERDGVPEATVIRPARASVPQVPAADVLVLRLDDGQCFEVRGTALLGRNPQPRAGEEDATLVPVNDLARTVSKTHAQVRWDGRTCWVMDRGSTNGTSVADAQGTRPVTEAAEVAVGPGGSVRIGDRELVLELTPGGGE